MHAKTSKRVKAVCFEFWCFFYAQNLFVKKENSLEIVLITSFYYTTVVLITSLYYTTGERNYTILLEKEIFQEYT